MVLGILNCSHVPLVLFGQRFSLSSTVGKMVNITSESGSAIDATTETIFKSYVAGDPMSFERKFLDPLDATPTAKVMIATNQKPKFKDRTQGIWRRMIFVPFDKVYEGDDIDSELEQKLSKHLPGIFNWFFEGMQILEEHGKFVEPTKCKNAIEEYKRDVNPAKAFLQDNYTVNTETEGQAVNEVYPLYSQWCKNNGHKPLNNVHLGQEVKRVLGIVKARKTIEGKRIAYYPDMAIRESAEILDMEVI